MLNILRAEQDKVMILRVKGKVDDPSDREVIRAALQACLQQGKYNLVLNLKSVEFIDNLSFGAVMEYLGLFRTLKGDIKLAEVSVQGLRLLRMMSLLRVFDVFEVESAAVHRYQREAA